MTNASFVKLPSSLELIFACVVMVPLRTDNTCMCFHFLTLSLWSIWGIRGLEVGSKGNVLIPVGGSKIETVPCAENSSAEKSVTGGIGSRVAQSLESVVDGTSANAASGTISANAFAQQAAAERGKMMDLEVEQVLKERNEADIDLKSKEHEKKMMEESDRHDEVMKRSSNRAHHNAEARALQELSDEESQLRRLDEDLQNEETNESLELENLKKEGEEEDLRQKIHMDTAIKNTIASAEEAEDAAHMLYDMDNPQQLANSIIECEDTIVHQEPTLETETVEGAHNLEALTHVECIPAVEPASITQLMKQAVEDEGSAAKDSVV